MDIADDASDELKLLAAKRQAERDEAARLKAEEERRRVEVVVPHEEAWSVLEDLGNFEANEVVSTLERLAETGRRAGNSAWLEWLPECAAAQKDVLMQAIAFAIRATVGDGECRPADAVALISILGGECVADKVIALRESGEDYERGRVLAAARETFQRSLSRDISPEMQKVQMSDALRRSVWGSFTVTPPPGALSTGSRKVPSHVVTQCTSKPNGRLLFSSTTSEPKDEHNEKTLDEKCSELWIEFRIDCDNKKCKPQRKNLINWCGKREKYRELIAENKLSAETIYKAYRRQEANKRRLKRRSTAN